MTLNDQITQQIQKLAKDWTRANRHQPEIARLDRDILFDDLRLLYDLIDELEVAQPGTHLSNQKPTTREEKIKDVPFSITNQDEHFVKGEKKDKPEKQEDDLQNPVAYEEETEKPFLEPAASAIKKENVSESSAPPSSVTSRKAPKSTGDQFVPAKTFADVYQKSDDTTLAAHIGSHAIPDIRTAIGVNDKFLFINEIFKGDVEVYQQTIDRLNRQKHMDDALLVIDEVKQKYAVAEAEVINKLIKIIQRKFQN